MLLSLNPNHFIGLVKTVPETNELWLDINSTDAGIEHFYVFADFMKRSWNIDNDSFKNIQGALSEALLNAVEHGNKWAEEKQIHIHARCLNDYFIISLHDEGDGFNYKKIANPTDAENRTQPGGRGIFLMNYLSDDVQFSDGGKRVKLLFRNKSRF